MEQNTATISSFNFNNHSERTLVTTAILFSRDTCLNELVLLVAVVTWLLLCSAV